MTETIIKPEYDKSLLIWRFCLIDANKPMQLLELDFGATCMIKSMGTADKTIQLSTTQSKAINDYWTLKPNECITIRCKKPWNANPKVKIFAVSSTANQWLELMQVNEDDSFLSFSQ